MTSSINSLSKYSEQPINNQELVLVLGATGKTGSRVLKRLEACGISVRAGSRTAKIPFDWNTPSGWDAALQGATRVYISYAPDLAIPGAKQTIEQFVQRAKAHNIKQLVLLSGRGEEEAQACEAIVQNSGIGWTIVRASWFNQNFSEGAFVDMVLAGAITLPTDEIPEPFVDADDIAAVAVAALTDKRHLGKLYEVTGPRLMTFADVARELSIVTHRKIEFIPISQDVFNGALEAENTTEDIIWLLNYLFATVLDGRNASIGNGVQEALGRPAKDFAVYAREVAETAIWEAAA